MGSKELCEATETVMRRDKAICCLRRSSPANANKCSQKQYPGENIRHGFRNQPRQTGQHRQQAGSVEQAAVDVAFFSANQVGKGLAQNVNDKDCLRRDGEPAAGAQPRPFHEGAVPRRAIWPDGPAECAAIKIAAAVRGEDGVAVVKADPAQQTGRHGTERRVAPTRYVAPGPAAIGRTRFRPQHVRRSGALIECLEHRVGCPFQGEVGRGAAPQTRPSRLLRLG